MAEVDNLITTCANEMWSHWNNTNISFQQRIQETTDAHNKLQSHLSKTMQEIYDQEKHIQALRKGLRDKEAPPEGGSDSAGVSRSQTGRGAVPGPPSPQAGPG